MALSNYERVGKALEGLAAGLRPFVQREMQRAYGPQAESAAKASLAANARGSGPGSGDPDSWDVSALVTIMLDQWRNVFGTPLGKAELNLVHELREVRNRWAHQEAFSTDDTYRALDSAQRLLAAVSAPQAAEVDRLKQEVLRVRFAEQARTETRRVAVAPIEGQPASGLTPWREIITPHPDVASGRYQQAEFAADLGQVARGEGSDEYRDPREFYRRTFLTEGLRHLLAGGLQRLSGTGGDPVVELQTNFGGGKTHSMLALYHLFSGVAPGDLAGIEVVLAGAGVEQLPRARRAVLVGTALSPAQPATKADGTVVHTMWGELAHQLLGQEGYKLVAAADRQGVSPGSDALRELFGRAAPALILIDEWVAYARNLWGLYGLTGGSFDANMSFAQALTEAAKAVPRTLLVASIPASDIEIGGPAGRDALERLRNTFGRVESAWRPATAEEGFEIVRRRLFQPITERQHFAARDVVVHAFAELYRSQAHEFPGTCREGDYERRIQAAYPIHPELFDRLYTDWSTLDKFQRTRGVLRLMAAVIHTLWERQDGSLLILPATVPVDAEPVQFELTRYLEEQWAPVMEKDVDGPNSLPLRLDRENPTFGRYSAARRVARTLFIGSAPTANMAHKGLEDRQIKLGCVQPGETPATFGDALRRLTDNATHLYVDGHRYWFATQPSVARLAQDRAAQQSRDAVLDEIRERLRRAAKTRGDFPGVHVCPPGTGDVPDERETRLVILDPDQAHVGRAADSPARQAAARLLDERGTGPRLYRNTLVFLAPDKARLQELEDAVRTALAWRSIEAERETLNLDPYQARQAQTKSESANSTVSQRLPETYTWLIAPAQSDPRGPVEWQVARLQGPDDLAVRAAKKLRNDDMLSLVLGGANLRLWLDRIPLWRDDHVGLKDLAEYFAQYLYLPRLRDPDVLVAAVRDGVAERDWETSTFAYAAGWDAAAGRYTSLKAGEPATVVLDSHSVVVKPAAARRQLDAEAAARPAPPAPIREQPALWAPTQDWPAAGAAPPAPATEPPAPHDPRRFYGSVRLSAARLPRDAGTIAEAVVAHLAALAGADVEITIEIGARIPDGAPPQVVRTVTENCRTLGFQNAAFEEE